MFAWLGAVATLSAGGIAYKDWNEKGDLEAQAFILSSILVALGTGSWLLGSADSVISGDFSGILLPTVFWFVGMFGYISIIGLQIGSEIENPEDLFGK